MTLPSNLPLQFWRCIVTPKALGIYGLLATRLQLILTLPFTGYTGDKPL